jgi:4-alpha-glucanotransferase
VAEDLGVITPDVTALRRKLRLPGMRVLQFAFGSDESPHLPERCEADTVLYTGTHDNDTARGWFAGLGPGERRRALEVLGGLESSIEWKYSGPSITAGADRDRAALTSPGSRARRG